MTKNSESREFFDLQGLLIITAILFLLAIPDVLPYIYNLILSLVIFLMSCYLAIRLWRFQMSGLGSLFGVIAIGYNPYYLYIQHFHTWFVADVVVALIIFIVALCWNSFVRTVGASVKNGEKYE